MMPVVKMLKERDPAVKVYFIGTSDGLEKEYIEKTDYFEKTYYLDAQGFKRSLSLSNLVTLWKYLRSTCKCIKIFREVKPDIVVGMGGYISGSAVRAALRLKIKTAIHEQNSVYGLANRILKKKVDLVLLSYPIDTEENTKVVGNPRISEIYERYKDRLQAITERTVLVVGGSRGAQKINDLVLSMKDDFEKDHIRIILITGKKYYQENRDKINQTSGNLFIVKALVSDLSLYLIKARVVVTRCGATTLAEVMALRKVCLLIPSPNVTNNHQEKNALEIVNREGAMMLRESELTRGTFFTAVKKLLDDSKLRSRIISNLIMISDVSACSKFVAALDELMQK